MLFEYEVVRLWERSAERLVAGELGLAPLAVLGELPKGAALVDGLAAVVQKLVDRLTHETQPEQATKLVTTALLLTGLRVSRNVALKIFRGGSMLEESDTRRLQADALDGAEKVVDRDEVAQDERPVEHDRERGK